VKKNILIVINAMGKAGAERVLISILNLLDLEKYNVDLLSIINMGEFFAEVPEGVHVINKNPQIISLLEKRGTRELVKNVLYNLFRWGYVFRYIPYAVKNSYLQIKRGKFLKDKFFWKCLSDNQKRPEKEYDLAVAFTEGAATYYVVDRVKAKKKIGYIHVDYQKAGYIKALDKKYYEQLDSIFCVSGCVRSGFLDIYPEHEAKTEVCNNVIIPENVRKNAKTAPGFEDGFTGIRLLTVARLHPQKAYEVAIEAFAKLLETGCEDVRWYVIGEGGERKKLEQMIEQYGLQGKFILMGLRDNPYPYMEQCDIYVHATHFEGWCIAIAEALILRRPVIVSDVAGNRDQVTHEENGLIIELTADNLAKNIKCLMEDKGLRQRFYETLNEDRVDYLKGLKMFCAAADEAVMC